MSLVLQSPVMALGNARIGLFTGSRPIIASNSVTLVLALCIVVLKLRYDRSAMEELEP